VNTNAIAKRARLPVGTLYQFFPNREAVLKALMQSQLDAFDEALWPLLAPSEDEQPLAGQIDRIVDALSKAYLRVPGLAPLLRALRYDVHFSHLAAANNARVAEALAELVKRRVPRAPHRRALAIATTVVEAADAVLMAWLQSRDAALLDELKGMLRAYGAELLRGIEHE
jgi:AcrR family transcriptional regulator